MCVGMQPLMFSVRRCQVTGEAHWERSGSNICYYRNIYHKGGSDRTCYWTLSFDLTFPYDEDVCYIAYHYPYTYSQLKVTPVILCIPSCHKPTDEINSQSFYRSFYQSNWIRVFRVYPVVRVFLPAHGRYRFRNRSKAHFSITKCVWHPS